MAADPPIEDPPPPPPTQTSVLAAAMGTSSSTAGLSATDPAATRATSSPTAPAATDPAATPGSAPRGQKPTWATLVEALLLFMAGGFVGFLLAFGVAALFVHPAAAPSTREAHHRLLSGVVDSPLFLVSTIWLTALCTTLFVLAAARPSPLGIRERLGLRRGRVTAGDLPVIVAADFGAIGCGLTLTYALQRAGVPGLQSSESGRMFGSLALAAPVLKLASLLGGSVLAPIQEELLFRGYLQRGLLRGWRPAVAIVVTGLLFALLHGEPIKWATLIFSSLWLGYLAWRADSILPSVVCHAGANGLFGVLALVFVRADAESASQWSDPLVLQHVPLPLVLGATLLSLVLLGQGIARAERRARRP